MDMLDDPQYETFNEFLSSEDRDWDSAWMYYEEEEEISEEFYEYVNSLTTWETKHLEIISISEMKTSHIKNCIKKIIREQWRGEYLWPLTKELIRRKEL